MSSEAKPPPEITFRFNDDKGDFWRVRDCGEDPGCTVVERLPEFAPDGEEPDSLQCLDIPADLCRLIGRALIERADRAERLWREGQDQ